MGRMLTITNSTDARLGVKKSTLKREIIIGPTAIKFIALTIFAILALTYLSNSTAGAARSIKIQNMDDQKTELQLKQERLEVEKVRLESLGQIDNSVQKPSMEPISQVQHLDSSDNALALR